MKNLVFYTHVLLAPLKKQTIWCDLIMRFLSNLFEKVVLRNATKFLRTLTYLNLGEVIQDFFCTKNKICTK